MCDPATETQALPDPGSPLIIGYDLPGCTVVANRYYYWHR
jgi:hypothetical protein